MWNLENVRVQEEEGFEHPVRGSSHDVTDGFVINIMATFDNGFIMDMTADKTVGEVTHGKTEKVSRDNLNSAYLQVVRNKGAEGVDGMDDSLYRLPNSLCLPTESDELRYKQRKTNPIWISLNVRLLHQKVCYLLS